MSIQLPRVIERGVGVNDSREFELLIGCHWHIGGGGMLIKAKVDFENKISTSASALTDAKGDCQHKNPATQIIAGSEHGLTSLDPNT